MDDQSNTRDYDNNAERSDEEVAWDEEFRDERSASNSSVASAVGELLSFAVKVPIALIQVPIELLPRDTRRHARAATRESFLAVRSLLGAIGDGIESMLAEPAQTTAGASGPSGTWGNTRYSPTQESGTATATESKVRRIELDESDVEPQRDSSAPATPTGPATSEEEREAREGRGLRADIDY
jgi:hypothetical protein